MTAGSGSGSDTEPPDTHPHVKHPKGAPYTATDFEHTRERGLGQRRASEVGVEHRAGGVQDSPEAGRLGRKLSDDLIDELVAEVAEQRRGLVTDLASAERLGNLGQRFELFADT